MDELMRLTQEDFDRIARGVVSGYTAHVVEAVISETNDPKGGWARIEPWPKDPFDIRMAIGTDAIACPHCSGSKTVYLKTRGRTTNYECHLPYTCICVFHRIAAQGILSVPAAFRRSGLLDINSQRQRERKTVLEAAFRIIRDNRTANFILLGPTGVGKTSAGFYLTMEAIYRKAWAMFLAHEAYLTPSVWHTTLTDLLTMHRDWESRKDGEVVTRPTIDKGPIDSAASKGIVPFLFLEEIDKMPRVTEHRSSVVFRVLDAMYLNQGQIVVTSNKRPRAFAAFLNTISEEGVLLRRLTDRGGQRSFVLNLFATDPADLVLDPDAIDSWPSDEAKVASTTDRPPTAKPTLIVAKELPPPPKW